MDVSSGIFALAGVALTAAATELRNWRESRSRRISDLFELRRETYLKGIRQIETVASQVAQWVSGETDNLRGAWDALTAAYETLNEIRLIVKDPETAETLHRAL